jgi:hypothetical protein
MSTALIPPYSMIAAIHASIQNTLKAELPSNLVISAIAPFLTSVNQWSTQIPAMLEGSGPSASVNLVFAIRKDLFIAPQFIQSVMGPSMADLPAPFQEFLTFIRKLIDAQKPEKVIPKVCSFCLCFSLLVNLSNLHRSSNAPAGLSNPNPMWMMTSPSI